MDFVGRSLPLSETGMSAAQTALSIGAPEVWTLLEVETKGCGFLPDRRPHILFERHIFYRQTSGVWDASNPSISSATPGGYLGGAAEYDRLSQAIALNQAAALNSTSWGIGQVLGYNAAAAGFNTAATMVAAMVDGEDAQLRAVTGFIRASGLSRSLAQHDWVTFAAGYNGPDFQKNQYDTRLAAAYARFSSGHLPQILVRQAQVLLTFMGMDCGGIDGILGNRTANAAQAFRSQHGLGNSAAIDSDLIAALRTALQ